MPLVDIGICELDAEGINTIELTVSGSNTLILVMIASMSNDDAITAVSWEAPSPQPITFYGASVVANPARAGVYRLPAPTAGTYNVKITSNSAYGKAAAYCFSNINQASPITANNQFTGSFPANPENITITVPSGGYAVDVVAVQGDNITPTIQNSATAVLADGNWWGWAASGYKLDGTQMGWAYTGLITQYAGFVVALNPASSATVPAAPTIGTAVVTGSGTVNVNGSANSDGGSPLTTPKFTATSTPENITGTSDTLPVPVTGLNPVVSYTFTLKAHNAIDAGYSAESAASNAVTPAATGSSGGVFSGALFRSAVIGP